MSNERFEDVVIPLDHEWITKYRMPVIHHWQASFAYPIAVVVASPSELTSKFSLNKNNIFPTDAEVALLSAYSVYRSLTWLRPAYFENVVRKDILDLDPGVVTYMFGKSTSLGWRYSSASWQHGPIPFSAEENGDVKWPQLIDLITHLETGTASSPSPERWLAWAEENADLVAAATASNHTVYA